MGEDSSVNELLQKLLCDSHHPHSNAVCLHLQGRRQPGFDPEPDKLRCFGFGRFPVPEPMFCGCAESWPYLSISKLAGAPTKL